MLGLECGDIRGEILLYMSYEVILPSLTRGWQKKVVFSSFSILYIRRKRPEWWKCELGWEGCKFVLWFYWQYLEKYWFQGCFWVVSRSYGAKMELICRQFPVRSYRRLIWGGYAGNIPGLWGQFTFYRYYTGSFRTTLCNQYRKNKMATHWHFIHHQILLRTLSSPEFWCPHCKARQFSKSIQKLKALSLSLSLTR